MEFKKLGRADRILCLIVDGAPNASTKTGAGQECFCPALRHQVDAEGRLTTEPVEPLAADIRPGNDRPSDARLKLVAGLIGINYDDLKQREKLRQRWRRVMAAAAAVALTIGIAGSWLAISDRAQEARRQQISAATRNAAKLLAEQSYFDVVKQPLAILPARIKPDQELPYELIALLEQALDRNRFEAFSKAIRMRPTAWPLPHRAIGWSRHRWIRASASGTLARARGKRSAPVHARAMRFSVRPATAWRRRETTAGFEFMMPTRAPCCGSLSAISRIGLCGGWRSMRQASC